MCGGQNLCLLCFLSEEFALPNDHPVVWRYAQVHRKVAQVIYPVHVAERNDVPHDAPFSYGDNTVVGVVSKRACMEAMP